MEGLEDLENYLRSARVLDAATFPNHGAHPSYRVVLEGGVGALAKPASTAPEDGHAMVRYEVAGWVIAKELSWSDLVATTVLRTLDMLPEQGETEASLQVLWPGFQVDADRGQFSDEDTWRAALFDMLIRHSDRSHNWGAVVEHGQSRLKLIDHGYAFRSSRGLSSVFAQDKVGQRIPDDLSDALEGFLSGCAQGPLGDLLEHDVLQELVARGRRMVESTAFSLL
jgi:hypothetical protein